MLAFRFSAAVGILFDLKPVWLNPYVRGEATTLEVSKKPQTMNTALQNTQITVQQEAFNQFGPRSFSNPIALMVNRQQDPSEKRYHRFRVVTKPAAAVLLIEKIIIESQTTSVTSLTQPVR